MERCDNATEVILAFFVEMRDCWPNTGVASLQRLGVKFMEIVFLFGKGIAKNLKNPLNQYTHVCANKDDEILHWQNLSQKMNISNIKVVSYLREGRCPLVSASLLQLYEQDTSIPLGNYFVNTFHFTFLISEIIYTRNKTIQPIATINYQSHLT